MRKNYGPIYTFPLAFWLFIFFVIPTGIIFLYSFLKKGLYGGVVWEFSLNAYKDLFNNNFLKVVLNTLLISSIATLLVVLVSIPTAYFIARSKYKNFFLFLIIIPFWTNFLIRIYAWIAILGNNGFINNLLIDSGITDKSFMFIYNKYAVIIVMVYAYLPYAILPLYSSIEKFDFSLLEAARDLGATKRQSIFKIMLPNIKGGITTAIILTFIPSLGAFAIPQLVGGKDSFMLGNLISRELTTTRNWPLAASMSMILTIVSTFGILVFLKVNKNKNEEVRENKLSQQL